MGLALTGTSLSAAEAVSQGLIWRSHADDELLPAAKNLTATLARGPTKAFANTKMLIRHAVNGDFDQQLELEASVQKICAESDDYTEGVKAFLDKREAKFSGN